MLVGYSHMFGGFYWIFLADWVLEKQTWISCPFGAMRASFFNHKRPVVTSLNKLQNISCSLPFSGLFGLHAHCGVIFDHYVPSDICHRCVQSTNTDCTWIHFLVPIGSCPCCVHIMDRIMCHIMCMALACMECGLESNALLGRRKFDYQKSHHAQLSTCCGCVSRLVRN